jgi:hypothetical protein
MSVGDDLFCPVSFAFVMFGGRRGGGVESSAAFLNSHPTCVSRVSRLCVVAPAKIVPEPGGVSIGILDRYEIERVAPVSSIITFAVWPARGSPQAWSGC